jgi:hypothetical protein
MKILLERLLELKKLGVTAVKQSTEDEGSSFNDISVMRRITKKAGVKLNVKIGGCEAKNDIFYCARIKADAIVAPMVESDYALKKFIQCAGFSKKCSLYLNLDDIISRSFHFEKEWLKKRALLIKKVDPFLVKEYQKRIVAITKREN